MMKIFFVCLFSLFCVVLSLPEEALSAGFPPGARQALSVADGYLKADKPAKAADVLADYLKGTSEKEPAEIYIFLGAAEYRIGHSEAALKAFSNGHKLYPRHETLCRNCAVLLYEMNRYSEAGNMFEKSFRLSKPLDGQLLYQSGAAFYADGDFVSAARVLAELLAAPELCKPEWVQLGIHSFIGAGQLDRAEGMLLSMLKNDPRNADGWELLAKVCMDRENYIRAAAALDLCYRLRGANLEELERLASLYRYVEAPLSAASVLERAYAEAMTGPRALKIAALYSIAGRDDLTVKCLNNLAEQSDDIQLEKVRVMFAGRNFSEAGKILSQMLKDYPDESEARFLSAMCAWERRDWDSAVKEFSKVKGNDIYGYQAEDALAALMDLQSAALKSVTN